MADPGTDDRFVGLCARCTFMRRILSSRGSAFYRCELSNVDIRFPKYPRLPVLECPGFTRIDHDDRLDALERT